MQYGENKVRYAVVEKDGHLREVIKGYYENLTADYKKNQPKPLVEIKNNGTTANDITLTDIGTNGSYIVKNNNNYVSAFGKIDSSTVSIPGGETVWTHGQQSDYDDNIVTGNNGQFEVKDWSNCKADALGSAFRNAKCIKIVPNSWPTDDNESTVTKLYRTFAGITLDNIPDWKYTDKVTDAREMLNGTTINGDLKIDSMIENLTSVTTGKKLLNNCTINDYSYTGGEYKFYNLYKQLKKTVANADAAACFGGTQYDKDSGTYTDSYNYACRFNYTDPSGVTGVVIPPDLMYIPQEWGGFLHRAYGYVTINDSDFKDSQMTINDVHINWGLASGYKTIKETNKNWNISTYRDFYSSVYYVLINECDWAGAHHKRYYANSGRTKTFSWGEMNLPIDTEYTLTVMVFLPAPGSTNPPHTENDQIVLNEDGEIDTDYIEVFLAPNAEYRDENGRYVRTGMVPVVTSYNIEDCTITYKNVAQGDTEITWTVSDAEGVRVDNGSNPPDSYNITLTTGTTVYTYASTTTPTVPLYDIPAGSCTDADGNDITNIPDGTYSISITANKDQDSCNKTGTINVKNWVVYDNTCNIVINTDISTFTWTVKVYRGTEDVTSSMIDTNSMSVWLYKEGTSGQYVPAFRLPNTAYELTANNVIKLKNITEDPGVYRINVSQVTSKNGWYIPTKGASEYSDPLTIVDPSVKTFTKVASGNGNAIYMQVTKTTLLHGFYVWSAPVDTTQSSGSFAWIAKHTNTSSTGSESLTTIAYDGINLEFAGVEYTKPDGYYESDTGDIIKKVNFKIKNDDGYITLEPGFYMFSCKRVSNWNWSDGPWFECSDPTAFTTGVIYNVNQNACAKTIGTAWQSWGDAITNIGKNGIFEIY